MPDPLIHDRRSLGSGGSGASGGPLDVHVIEQLRAEAELRGHGEAQARWHDFVRGPALRLIDEVLDEVDREACAPGEVWRLPALTLELGEVSGPDWEDQWRRRLRKSLRDALDDLRGPAGGAHRPVGLRGRTQARLDLLLHFLRHGTLPWQARGEDPAALAKDLLRRDPAALAAALRSLEGRALWLRRLVLQFDRAWLAALVHALMPDEPAGARRLLDSVAGGGWHGMTPTALVAVWEAVIDEALSQGGARREAPLQRARARLLAALAAGETASAEADPLRAMADDWERLLADDADWLRGTLQRYAHTGALRRRLTAALAPPLLPRLLGLWLGDTLRVEVERWIEAIATGTPATAVATAERRQWLWQATLDQALRGETGSFDTVRYVSRVREHLAVALPETRSPRGWFDRVADAASGALAAAARALGLRWRGRGGAKDGGGDGSMGEPPAPPPLDETLTLGNAGVVLIAPYLPRLFEMLGLVQAGRFRDEDAQWRAVRVLELVTHGAVGASEDALPLSKLLCGLDLAAPLPRGGEPDDAMRKEVDGLLDAVIAHWAALRATSREGLRETFLQRRGRLRRDRGPDQDRPDADSAWRLEVEPGPFDMLLDRLPWGYSVVKFGWMERILHVDWR